VTDPAPLLPPRSLAIMNRAWSVAEHVMPPMIVLVWLCQPVALLVWAFAGWEAALSISFASMLVFTACAGISWLTIAIVGLIALRLRDQGR
jgi:hypothetical protein